MSSILRIALLTIPMALVISNSDNNSSATSSLPGTFTVNLGKQHVPVVINGRTVMHKTAYFGMVHVGVPAQSFSVVFDTGSGHVFLPSITCVDESCLMHKTYDRNISTSAVPINYDGSEVTDEEKDRDQVSISYGTGQVIGAFVNDLMCIGSSNGASDSDSSSLRCTRVRIVLARNMTSEPFRHFGFDGVLGLGLGALALEPEFHFFNLFSQDHAMQPVFGVFLAKHDSVDSQITFGGYDESKIQEAIQWAPVLAPERGYWRVAIRRILVGDTVVPLCEDGGCSAILDTGTSMLGVPPEAIDPVMHLSERAALRPSVDCRRVPGPPLVFDLGEFSVKLEAEDYTRPAEMPGNGTQAMCGASLLPVDMPTLGKYIFLWGEPVLHRYYTAYDSRLERIGFAQCAQPTGSQPSAKASEDSVTI